VASACAAISSSAEKRDLCAVLTQRSQWWSKSQKCNTQSSAPPATVTVAVGTEQIAPTAPPSGSARADQLAQGADEALVAMRSSCRGRRVRPPPPRPPPRPRPPPLPFSLSRAKLSFSWADVDGQEAGRWPSLILAQRAGVACRVLNLPCRRCRTHGRQDQGMWLRGEVIFGHFAPQNFGPEASGQKFAPRSGPPKLTHFGGELRGELRGELVATI